MIIPKWVWYVGAVLAFAAYSAFLHSHGAKQGKLECESYYKQKALEAEQAARAEENRKRVNNERNQIESVQRETKLRNAANDARSELDRLRHTIAGGSEAPADTSTDSGYAEQARNARELLGTCAAEYTDMAAEAGKLASQVTDWINYYEKVIK